MRKSNSNEAEYQKQLFIEKHQSLIELYHSKGYILKFRFIKFKFKKTVKYYVVSEIYSNKISKNDAIKSNSILIYVYPFMRLSDDKNIIYKNQFDIRLKKRLKKLSDDNIKLKHNKVFLFLLFLLYPKFYKQYYKTDFSLIVILILFIFVLAFGIFEAIHYMNFMHEVFGIYS